MSVDKFMFYSDHVARKDAVVEFVFWGLIGVI